MARPEGAPADGQADFAKMNDDQRKTCGFKSARDFAHCWRIGFS
jgi:hypothetical protein